MTDTGFAQLNERAREIFRVLVETYTATGRPVGSRTISRALKTDLSPASVRNVMADLEDLGLIHAPHTSAGRLPTQAGLRFFVEAVMDAPPLSEEERARIDAMVADLDTAGGVEQVLEQTSGVLSGLSRCAGLVLAPRHNLRLKHLEFVALSPGRALVILVGQDGTVENRVIRLPGDIPESLLRQAANFITHHYAGLTIRDTGRRLAADIETVRRELDELAAQVVAAGIATWSRDNAGERRLIVRGRAHLLQDAERAEDLERLRQLFADLEEKRGFAELLDLAEEGEGVRIFIGSENRLFSLSGSSLIVAPFGEEGRDIVGVLGIIGPTRLPYARLIPVVDYTARAVTRLLS